VTLPPALAGRAYVDALSGASVAADGTIEITLPPVFGTVLVSETP
jgi:cyclomaltodextrinase / maltogenic alpha-amylase / neopullulanase